MLIINRLNQIKLLHLYILIDLLVLLISQVFCNFIENIKIEIKLKKIKKK